MNTGRMLVPLLTAVVLMASCSAELPPNARGPLWEQVLEREARSARNGMIVGVVVLMVGAALIVAGLVPGVEILATIGLGHLRVYEAPIGLAVMVIGLVIIRWTRFQIKVSDGSDSKGRRR